MVSVPCTACKAKAFVADAHPSWHTKRFDTLGGGGDEDGVREQESIGSRFFFFIFTISDQLATSNVSIQSRQAFALAPTADAELPITCECKTSTCVREGEQTQEGLGITPATFSTVRRSQCTAAGEVTVHKNNNMLRVNITVPFSRFFISGLFNSVKSTVCSW